MRNRNLVVKLACAALLAGGLLAHSGTARAQGFSCFNFGEIAGNFSGVGITNDSGFGSLGSTFSFLAVNNTGGVVVFHFFNNGFGTGGITSLLTGSAVIADPNTCLIVGTVFDSFFGVPVAFVAKVADGGRLVYVSTPFDGFTVFSGTFSKD